MKETIQKSLIISLLLTNIWSVIAFFIYFFESSGLFHGFQTLIFFMYSCWISAALGILILLLSFLKIWKSNYLKKFLFVIIGWFNIFLSILLLITFYFEVIDPNSLLDVYFISNFIISFLVFFSFLLRNKEVNNQPNIKTIKNINPKNTIARFFDSHPKQ